MTSRAFAPVVQGAVEGDVDEAVLSRLVVHAGGEVGTVFGRKGKDHLRNRVNGYNSAAHRSLWMVLVDLDHQRCAPLLTRTWLPHPSQSMCFRVAVREIEAWLMADRERFASFIGVARTLVPVQPESVNDPKGLVVQLATRSRKREIREDLVPTARSGRKVGPAYTSRLIEFAHGPWRPDSAASASDSLNRAMRCLKELVSRSPVP